MSQRAPEHTAATADGGYRRTAGRAGGLLFLVSGVSAVADGLSFWGHHPVAAAALLAIGAVASATGAVLLRLPWQRWSPWASLWLVPPALALIGGSNAADPNPYLAAPFLFMLALWVGVAQPRGTALALSPLFGAVYWASLALVPHAPGLEHSVPYVTGACAAVGETLAWLTARLRQALGRLREHDERRFQALLAGSSDTTVVIGAAGMISYVSPSAARVLQLEREVLEGVTAAALVEQCVHPDDSQQLLARTRRLFGTAGGSELLEFRMARPDGSWRDVEGLGRNLLADDAVRGVLVNLRDVSERKQLERALVHEAFHDQLSGLANRALFGDRLRHAQARPQRLAVLFCDLDGFKQVNDRFGHVTGDGVLAETARRLSSLARPADTLARLGGDEFAILVEDAGDDDELLAFAEHVRGTLAQPVPVDDQQVPVGVSVGVAAAPSEGAGDLLGDADLAMYAAKRHGKGRVELYRPKLRRDLVTRMELQADLESAIVRGELRVHYQPIVHLGDGRVLGVEALVRWQHPRRGLLGPDQFIGVAEDSGLITQIDRWVLGEACRHVRALQARFAGLAELQLSVNLSPAQLADDGLIEAVRATLRDSGMRPALLVLEVTESLLLDHGLATAARLRALKALGVRLAVDDFGAGYSSLRYLRDHPFDILKVDKSFIDQIGANGNGAELVRSLGEMGRSLGVDTVAEGVERDDQATAIRAMGFTRAQGFLFSRPLTPSDLEGFLSARLDRGAAPIRQP